MTTYNPYKELLGLLPARPLHIGTVLAVGSGIAHVELPGGAVVQARGSATAGQKVYVRDGAIEGVAPSLPVDVIVVGA